MAKNIKAIKCPQCGSVKHTLIKDDQYRCGNCGTEYFLDSDDVNVNVRHTYDGYQTQQPHANPATVLKIVFGFLGGVTLIILMPMLIRAIFSSGGDGGDTPGKVGKHSYYPYEDTPVVIGGKVWIACFGYRTNYDAYNRREEFAYWFVDALSGKTEHIAMLDQITEHKDSDMRRFADGNVYLVVNKKFVYKLNREKMVFEDYSPVLRDSGPDFSTGFASVDITFPRDGDAFDLMSNVGKEYKYYPIPGLLMTEDEAGERERGISKMLPGARDSLLYVFTKPNKTYRGNETIEHPARLLEVVWKYNAGGPQQMFSKPDWDRSRNDGKPDYFYAIRYSRVVRWRDVTPGRLWFDAEVAYADNKGNVLVSSRATAAEDAPVSIQKINITTGEVEWSTPVRTPDRRRFYHFDESIAGGGNFVIKDERKIYLILAPDGKLIKELNLNPSR